MCGPHTSLCSSAASHPTYGPAKAVGRRQTRPVELKSDHQTYINLKLAKINKFHMGRRTICMFRKIEQACSILKEVYICCSKIVDPVSLSKGRCAQSVSIKNRYFVICFYCCETDRMIFEGNIICLTFS